MSAEAHNEQTHDYHLVDQAHGQQLDQLPRFSFFRGGRVFTSGYAWG